MKFNTLNVKGPLNAGVDQLVERYVAGSAATSKTFSNLAGDTALVYYIKARIIEGAGASTNYRVRPNNDSGANYGYQRTSGNSTTAGAAQGTADSGFYLMGAALASGNVGVGELTIFAKSGAVRRAIIEAGNSISSTTVTTAYLYGQVWTNTADQITSIAVVADQTNGIGVGSIIELWARRGVRN